MHWASVHGNTEMVKALAQFGASLDEQDNAGNAPAHASYLRPNVGVVYDLALGADASIATTRATRRHPRRLDAALHRPCRWHCDDVR